MNILINEIIERNKIYIQEDIKKYKISYQNRLSEDMYKLKLIENGLIKSSDDFKTKICKLYLILNSVDTAKVLNELGYRIKTKNIKGSNGERKYRAKDITELIDSIRINNENIDKKLLSRVKMKRRYNIRFRRE